ncbi:SEC-C domain-containing protein [Chromatium okenii]|uniref:Uncharacterized protein n=1 Tax=Chromatium okenii TaxID=61644 RepID=A0A2S7XVB8_9GAMM|nr:SEC-C domain-containing protein [Chromatium okenii]PQJ95721.1 hypothetical protein CXB77_16900 [Chromatium okenii]PQJ97687.1 hypothetical protein CXB77_00080 [Chromatium okenii]
MFQYDVADSDDFEQIIVQAVQRILEVPDPNDFLNWARETIPPLLTLPNYMDALERGRFATLLGVTIWNATPLPQHGFTIRPIPTPMPNARCYCGSGLRYRDCCSKLEDAPELSSEVIWMVLINALSDAELKRALQLNAVPKHLLAIIADQWLDENRPRRVLALLEPLFAESLAELSGDFEPAFDILCNAYDLLDYSRKKAAFLDRVCAEGNGQLQAAAWQRRSTMHLDAGEFTQAEEAFTAALRSHPNNPSTALLEITLLVTQKKLALARQRAQFWLHQFQRLENFDDDLFLSFLERAVTDPQGALMDADENGIHPVLIELREWITQHCQRPLPVYTIAPFQPTPGRKQRVSRLLPNTIKTRSTKALEKQEKFEFLPPPSIRKTERVWQSLFPIGKPLSTQLTLSDDEDEEIWGNPEWIQGLLEYPELADSLDVLDDIATALGAYPETELPWISQLLLWPLLERAWSIIIAATPTDDIHYLPWEVPSNQPALRLLFRRYYYQLDDAKDLQGAIATLETMLRINPHDNHGVRAELMNLYLRDGDNERAVALAQQFPNDMLTELVYGEVLALYRLGQKEQARIVLTKAAQRMPHVSNYLTRKRIKQPGFNPRGITVGGEDQAWFYREEMRDVWAAEPGILDWLKRQTA